MGVTVFANATLILPDRLEQGSSPSLMAPSRRPVQSSPSGRVIDLAGMYLAPGFVDLRPRRRQRDLWTGRGGVPNRLPVPRAPRHHEPDADQHRRAHGSVLALSGSLRRTSRQRPRRRADCRRALLRPVLRPPGPGLSPRSRLPHAERRECDGIHAPLREDAARHHRRPGDRQRRVAGANVLRSRSA